MDRFSNEAIEILLEIRDWIKASSYSNVRALLEDALPDEKSRTIYQMSDGNTKREQIRKHCGVSPNKILELHRKCIALGLMSDDGDKRCRIFNLKDFGLI